MIVFWSEIGFGEGVPPWGHPGTPLHSEMLSLNNIEVTETEYGTVQKGNFTQTVFQYEASITPTVFQQLGETYWISIQAINYNSEPIQWGWQNSTDHWSSNAVQKGFDPSGPPTGWWYELPGQDMSFELDVIPLPSSISLLVLGGLAMLRRCKR